MSESRVDIKTRTGESKSISVETLLKLDDSFNIAFLLGRAMLAAEYQLQHPEEKEQGYHDSLSNDIRPTVDVNSNDGRLVFPSDEYEASVSNQIAQIRAMFNPEILAVIRPSALYDMLILSGEELGLAEIDLLENYSSSSCRLRAALAWLIAKRVFSIRHPEETIAIINIPWFTIKEAKPIDFRPFDNTDRSFISEVCSSLQIDDSVEAETDLQQKVIMAEKLEQLKNSSVISSPTSLAFWRQSEAAATGISKKTGEKKSFTIPDVYTKPLPANVELTISSAEGRPVEITGFDMALQATIGQMIRENDNKPVQASPAQIFRKCAGLAPNASVSPSSIEDTINSILKMRDANTTISYAQQLDIFLKNRNNKNGRNQQPDFNYSVSKIEGKLIYADRVRTAYVAANGKLVDDIFIFYRAPIIEHYSYGFKQLMEVDKKYLAGALNKATPENISFARYILVQINSMKNDKIPNTILTFETIAARCVYDISSRKKLRNFQAKVFAYCENLAKMGHIQKVEQYYKGRVYTGVKFTL